MRNNHKHYLRAPSGFCFYFFLCLSSDVSTQFSLLNFRIQSSPWAFLLSLLYNQYKLKQKQKTKNYLLKCTKDRFKKKRVNQCCCRLSSFLHWKKHSRTFLLLWQTVPDAFWITGTSYRKVLRKQWLGYLCWNRRSKKALYHNYFFCI